MNPHERKALEALRVDWAPAAGDAWQPPEGNVEELNAPALDAVLAAFGDAQSNERSSPLGIAVVGQQGAGKTHLIRRAHEEVVRREGYFFLLGLVQTDNFWQNVRRALLTGFDQSGFGGQTQIRIVLGRLAGKLALPERVARQVAGEVPLTKPALDEAVAALCEHAPGWGRECRHTARALILFGARDPDARDIAESYLTSESDDMLAEQAQWGIRGRGKPAQQVVKELSELIAFTGPSMMAVDQIDALVSMSGLSTDIVADTAFDLARDALMSTIAVGLMDLREATRRTVTVVSCQPHVWEQIRNSQPSAGQRFRREMRLRALDSAEVARRVVAERFAPRFVRTGFRPPYPTWPVLPGAFEEAIHHTPRQLFMDITDHIDLCLRTGTVEPLTGFAGSSTAKPESPAAVPETHSDLERLDAEFAELLSQVDPSPAVEKSTEDGWMPKLLIAGLRCHTKEIGEEASHTLDRSQGNRPAIHARLRKILDPQSEDQLHWAFRAVSTTHPGAAQNRIRAFHEEAGLDPRVPKRKAFLLLTGSLSLTTSMTAKLLKSFQAAGGVLIESLDFADLKVFDALERMSRAPDPAFDAWVRARRPAGRTTLFRQVFGDPGVGEGTSADGPPGPDAGPAPDSAAWPTDDLDYSEAERPAPASSTTDNGIGLGRTTEAGWQIRVPLESLRKHTVVFAGSGSGKTVLIRRLVEECALRGVSAIVLDPNNDLARLGDAWPQPPDEWEHGDAGRARDYLRNVEVLVWTPRLTGGRPLSLQPLPDLVSLVDEPDEFGLALDTAVAGLAPRARMDGTSAKAEQGRAVLREALSGFAHQGGVGLHAFLEFLADLPEGTTTLSRAQAMATEISETLRAAMINDPLFGGRGTPLDPGVLLSPSPGKRARISVISMVGLPTDAQRQGFVNQLQMALFAWIKQHPAAERPLGGLFVMDEAQTLAPSDGKTACTASTLALASQARKYGLGLVFATQAPKGIHNRIAGNAATQFFGFLNSPVQVAAAQQMAAARGSAVLEISRLHAGEFYFVAEGAEFRKVRTPMCLSHHPSSALSTEDVLARARARN